MKKLLTLVLALVLVFAIAAPALAITGDTEDPTPDPTLVDVVEMDLALFTEMPAPTQFAGFGLSPIAANKAYIVNELCFYGIAVEFAKDDKTHDLAMAQPDYWDSDLIISSDALDLMNLKEGYIVNQKGKVFEITGKLHPVDNVINLEDVDDDLWGSGKIVYLFGKGVVTAKGVLKAELKKDFDFEHGQTITIYDGTDELFDVTHRADGFEVYDYENEGWVFFAVNPTGTHKDEVSSIQVDIAGDAIGYQEVSYTVPVSGGGSVIEKIGSFTKDDLTAAKAVYGNVMSFFGFNYDAEGVLLPKHFLAKASGLYLKDEVAIQLYTAAIVVPGGVEPPKTGDAATVIGFVMIAVAMIAAGVVVSRKVRA